MRAPAFISASLLLLVAKLVVHAEAAPKEWKATVPSSAKAAQGDDWWQGFNDPQLTKLILEAKATYPGLKTVVARIDQARAAVRSAQAARYPQGMLNTDLGRSRGSDTLYQFSFGTLGNLALVTEVSYELDLWGRLRGQVNAAKAQETAAAADAQNLGLMLASEVARVYFALRSVDEENTVLQDTLKLRHEALDLATARVEAGATNELDRVRAEAELATTEAEIAALIAPRAELENTLALALGRMASNYKVAAATLPLALPSIPKVLPSDLVRRRPDVASASERVQAAQAKLGVTKASYLPKISLGGGIGLQTSQADRFFERESGIWSMGLKVSVPLYGGGQRKAALNMAEAVLKEATGQYEEKVLIAFKEVESQLAALNAQQQQSAAQDKLLTAATAAAKLARQRYTEGVATYLEVIEAERMALNARRAIVHLRGQRLLTAVQLVKALGGGWTAQR